MQIETLLENISDAIMAVDHDWTCIEVNHRAELLLRQRSADLIGRTYWEIFPDTLGTPAELELRRAARDRLTIDLEQFVPSIYAWHHVRAVPTRSGMMLISRDITDRMRMLRDEAIRAGIREIIEHVPISVTIMRGPELRIELQNAASRAGLPDRSVEGLPLRVALPELEGQGYFEMLEKVYATGIPYEGRELPINYYPAPGGPMATAYVDVIYQPIFETDGQVSGVLSMSIDMTRIVEERNRLARLAAERDAILQQLVEGVIITDRTGRITYVNDAAARLHGVARLDVEPEDYTKSYDLLTDAGEPFPPHELPLARAAEHDETVLDARWRIRRPDGSIVSVVGNARPIHDERGEKIAAVLTMRELREDE